MGDLIGFPPHRCWSLKQVCNESNLLSICALAGEQVLVDRTQPVIGHYWVYGRRKLVGSEPQKLSQSIKLGWGGGGGGLLLVLAWMNWVITCMSWA
jgi:hypothetical protein